MSLCMGRPIKAYDSKNNKNTIQNGTQNHLSTLHGGNVVDMKAEGC